MVKYQRYIRYEILNKVLSPTLWIMHSSNDSRNFPSGLNIISSIFPSYAEKRTMDSV